MKTEQPTDLMEWRVLMCPLDDFDMRISGPLITASIIEDCVDAFRRRLQDELTKGRLPAGYGPVK